MNSKREIHSNDPCNHPNDANNSRELKLVIRMSSPTHLNDTPKKALNEQMNAVSQVVNSTNFLGNFSLGGPPPPCVTSLKGDDPPRNQDSR